MINGVQNIARTTSRAILKTCVLARSFSTNFKFQHFERSEASAESSPVAVFSFIGHGIDNVRTFRSKVRTSTFFVVIAVAANAIKKKEEWGLFMASISNMLVSRHCPFMVIRIL